MGKVRLSITEFMFYAGALLMPRFPMEGLLYLGWDPQIRVRSEAWKWERIMAYVRILRST